MFHFEHGPDGTYLIGIDLTNPDTREAIRDLPWRLVPGIERSLHVMSDSPPLGLVNQTAKRLARVGAVPASTLMICISQPVGPTLAAREVTGF